MLLPRYNLCHNKYTPLCRQRKCLLKKKITNNNVYEDFQDQSPTNSEVDRLVWIIPQHLQFVFVKNVSGANIYPEFTKSTLQSIKHHRYILTLCLWETSLKVTTHWHTQYFYLQWINKIKKKVNTEGFNSKSIKFYTDVFNTVLLTQYSTCELRVHCGFMNSKYLWSKVKIWSDLKWCNPFPICLMLLHTKHWIRALFLTTIT